MHVYDTLLDALKDLAKRGYVQDFDVIPNGIKSRELDLQLYPEDFSIDEFYRFEGDSDPDENSIIFAISSKSGIKGTLIDAYGVYSEMLSSEMIEKLKVK